MQMSIPITPEADHTEDEADHVEEEEEAHGEVKENQLASWILIVDKANGLPDPRIERRVLQGDRVGSESEEGDNGWESPANSVTPRRSGPLRRLRQALPSRPLAKGPRVR